MLLSMEYGCDIYNIVNRVTKEAIDGGMYEKVNDLINAEIYAYLHFRDITKVHYLVIEDEVNIVGDVVTIGNYWDNEEDMEDSATGRIAVKSFIDDEGIYRAYYYKMPIMR